MKSSLAKNVGVCKLATIPLHQTTNDRLLTRKKVPVALLILNSNSSIFS